MDWTGLEESPVTHRVWVLHGQAAHFNPHIFFWMLQSSRRGIRVELLMHYKKKRLYTYLFFAETSTTDSSLDHSLSLSRWVKSLLLFFYAGKLAEGRWGRVLVSFFFFPPALLMTARAGGQGRRAGEGGGGGEGGRWGRGQTQSL